MSQATRINKRHCTNRLNADYAHVGLLDVSDLSLWIARRRFGANPIRVSHAKLLVGGDNNISVADKDRFVCYWFHTPNSGDGLVHGYPIEWDEGHLMIRLDPNWNYQAQELIRSTDAAKIEHNIDRQFAWGQRIFDAYVDCRPRFPLSFHMVGPRPTDSMFYIQRVEAQR